MMSDAGAHPIAPRDFRGYGGDPPDPEWPDGARLAVSLVVNVEEGAELSMTAGDERNESVYEVQDEVVGAPDPCMESHFEYGTRAGFWRIVDLFDRFDVKATFSACGRALESSPWLGADAIERGHEVSAHGYRWEAHAGMDEDQEREVIRCAVDAIRASTGNRPVGWHTRSAASVNTRRLLIEEGGFLYDSDAYNDDLPYVVTVAGTPHVVLPYGFDTNDMRFTLDGGFVHADDFARYCIDAFDWLLREGGTRPKMMSVGVHLRVIGKPGRIAGLEKLLQHVCAKDGVWIARRRDIAHHWRARVGLPEWAPAEDAA